LIAKIKIKGLTINTLCQ